MKTQPIEVLSDATNLAVVRMPGRKYSGLVVQGDRLIGITARAKRVAELAAASGNQTLTRLSAGLHFELAEMLDAYGEVCRNAGGETA
jgi:hypothetical protein